MADAFRCSGWIAGCLAALAPAWLTGCALLEAPPATQTSAFAWFTNWASQPADIAPGFDAESLRPEPLPAAVAPGDMLEVTVWDLYEPGKPYTFPVRVSERRTVEAPFLGEFLVDNRSLAQIESGLAEAYQSGEFLVKPRVLVRSLDSPTIKVQVSGALLRPGFVELSRSDTSVYAALVSAGGVKKSASAQVAIVRRPRAHGEDWQTAEALSGTSGDPARDRADVPPIETPEQHANSPEVLSVGSARPAAQSGAQPADRVAARVPLMSLERQRGIESTEGAVPSPVWHDLTDPAQREALRAVRLNDGDEVIVKAAAPPVRIGGVVERPGAYPLPNDRSLDVWQALEMAGGVGAEDVPLNITLIHPASPGRAAKRWFLNVPRYDQRPEESPLIEPGDVLHVEPTAGSLIRRAMGDLWNKP